MGIEPKMEKIKTQKITIEVVVELPENNHNDFDTDPEKAKEIIQDILKEGFSWEGIGCTVQKVTADKDFTFMEEVRDVPTGDEE